MLGVDIAVGIAVLSLMVVGASIIQALRKKQQASDPDVQAKSAQKKGAENLHRMEINDKMLCAGCDKAISPKTDLFVNTRMGGVWWHETCYRKILRGDLG